MRMRSGILAIWAIGYALLASGCASYLSYDASRKEILSKRIYASGNADGALMLDRGHSPESAIRAMHVAGGGVGIGIDVTHLEALRQHPIRQVGAAVVDGLTVWGVYEGIQELNDRSNSDDSSGQNSGRDSTSITINGDGNDVTVGDQKTQNGYAP